MSQQMLNGGPVQVQFNMQSGGQSLGVVGVEVSVWMALSLVAGCLKLHSDDDGT